MDSSPLISCIIPTRDRPEYLRRAVDSILDQTYDNVELIVVASPPHESTRQIVQEYKGKNCVVNAVYIQDTSGPIVARNVGINEAKGEYIAFLDDDDVWKSEKLEKQAEYLDEYSIVSSLVQIQKEEKIIDIESEIPNWMINEIGIVETFCNYITLYPSCVIMRKSELRSVGGFDEEFRNFGIWDLSLKLLDKYDTAYVLRQHLVIYQDTDDYERLVHDTQQLAIEEFETYRRHREKVPQFYRYEVGKQLGFRAFDKVSGISRYKYFLFGLSNLFQLMIRGFPSETPGG